jgi:hypothetical protein
MRTPQLAGIALCLCAGATAVLANAAVCKMPWNSLTPNPCAVAVCIAQCTAYLVAIYLVLMH